MQSTIVLCSLSVIVVVVIVVVNFSHFPTNEPISTKLGTSILGERAFKFVQMKGQFPLKREIIRKKGK